MVILAFVKLTLFKIYWNLNVNMYIKCLNEMKDNHSIQTKKKYYDDLYIILKIIVNCLDYIIVYSLVFHLEFKFISLLCFFKVRCLCEK